MRTDGDDPVAALQARAASIEAALLAPVQPTAELKRFQRKPQGASAYVKISEGCDHSCAFCIIPAIRGKHISRPIAEIAAEVRELTEQGVREVMFIAQDSTYYGVDLKKRDGLAELLEAVTVEAPDLRWLRLMYAYPTQITPRLIETMARLPQVCHYLDMPLQHGHPETLRRMRRPNDVDRVRRLIADLRAAMPDIALRSTFIVGFPGETDAEFQTLLDFLTEIQFDHVGMFIYSPEEGTRGAAMPDQAPERVKQRRYKQAMQHQQGIAAKRNAGWVGRRIDVLIEGDGTVEDGRGRRTPILRRPLLPPGPRGGRPRLRQRPPGRARRRRRARARAAGYRVRPLGQGHRRPPPRLAPAARGPDVARTGASARVHSSTSAGWVCYARRAARPGICEGAPGPLVRLAKEPACRHSPGPPGCFPSSPCSPCCCPAPRRP